MNLNESYQFTDLKELRDFLNGFKDTDLSTIWPDESYAGVSLNLKERNLTDDSKVNDFKFTMI
ncbi:MAG: hypothetical protein KJO69_02410 [Gammaproteobacteria bacterium]|nr:hypothetical protein [Gammaproteobacteria bacterium]